MNHGQNPSRKHLSLNPNLFLVRTSYSHFGTAIQNRQSKRQKRKNLCLESTKQTCINHFRNYCFIVSLVQGTIGRVWGEVAWKGGNIMAVRKRENALRCRRRVYSYYKLVLIRKWYINGMSYILKKTITYLNKYILKKIISGKNIHRNKSARGKKQREKSSAFTNGV